LRSNQHVVFGSSKQQQPGKSEKESDVKMNDVPLPEKRVWTSERPNTIASQPKTGPTGAFQWSDDVEEELAKLKELKPESRSGNPNNGPTRPLKTTIIGNEKDMSFKGRAIGVKKSDKYWA
jgi:hypothetical protein